MNRNQVPVERRVVTGSLLAGVSFVLTMLQTLVQVPLLLRFWSPDEFGMWMAVLAATSLVTRLDIGHQNFVGNLLNRYWVEDRARLRAVFASGVLAAFTVAAVELVAGILLLVFGKAEWLSGPVPESGRNDFRIAFFAYLLFWVAQGSVGGILSRLYQPAGMFARSQVIAIFYYLAGFLALIFSAALGASIAGAMLAQVSVWTLSNAIMFWDVKRKFPEFFPWWRGGALGLAWKNFRASLVLTVNGVVEQLGSSGLVLLVMGMMAPVEVAVFTTIRTVANTALQGVSVILFPVVPDVVRYHVCGQPAKLASVFALVWCVAGSVVGLGFSAGAPWIQPLYGIWTRHALPFSPVLFVVVVVAVGFRQWAMPFQTYLHGVNFLAPQTLAIVLRTAGSLAVARWLLRTWGIGAAGVGLLVGEVLASAVYYFAARQSLGKMGGAMPSVPAILSLGQIAAMASGLAAALALPAHANGIAFVSALVVAVCGWLQWAQLDSVVKRRLWSLLPERWRWMGGQASGQT